MRRAEIEQLLPSVFRRTALPGTPMHAALDAMEGLHEPAEAVLAELDRYVDPRRAPIELVELLAEWVDLGWLVSRGEAGSGALPEDALRRLVAEGAALAQARGTREGLLRMLSLATGSPDFEVVASRDERGAPRPFAFTVVAPPELDGRVGLIATILRRCKPAYVQCELRFGRDGEPLRVTDAPAVVPASGAERPAGARVGHPTEEVPSGPTSSDEPPPPAPAPPAAAPGPSGSHPAPGPDPGPGPAPPPPPPPGNRSPSRDASGRRTS